jgi:hypothetical protein
MTRLSAGAAALASRAAKDVWSKGTRKHSRCQSDWMITFKKQLLSASLLRSPLTRGIGFKVAVAASAGEVPEGTKA